MLFVALSIHVRVLEREPQRRLRAVAGSVFLGYVVSLAIRRGALWPACDGSGYDRKVTVLQFIAGFALFAVSIAASIGRGAHLPRATHRRALTLWLMKWHRPG